MTPSALETAAHALIEYLIRLAREAGRNWHEIGDALDLHNEAVAAKESIADVPYCCTLDYQRSASMRTFTCTCPACQQLITDQDPFDELPHREKHHADDCARRATEFAEGHEHHGALGNPSQRTSPTHRQRRSRSNTPERKEMDEYEIARRASKLPDQFANRLDPEKLEGLRQMDMGGEFGELTIELAATLAAHGTPVSAAERDEMQALLDAMGMPTDPIRHLSVDSSR